MIPIEDLTDVTLAIEEVIKRWKFLSDDKWWKLSSDKSYQVIKVNKWWKLSIEKVIKWWKLTSDES